METNHRGMRAHDEYEAHSHEVRPDHLGVKTRRTLGPDELLHRARSATYNDHYKEASDYWLMLDTQASAGNLPREWRHF